MSRIVSFEEAKAILLDMGITEYEYVCDTCRKVFISDRLLHIHRCRDCRIKTIKELCNQFHKRKHRYPTLDERKAWGNV